MRHEPGWGVASCSYRIESRIFPSADWVPFVALQMKEKARNSDIAGGTNLGLRQSVSLRWRIWIVLTNTLQAGFAPCCCGREFLKRGPGARWPRLKPMNTKANSERLVLSITFTSLGLAAGPARLVTVAAGPAGENLPGGSDKLVATS